MFGDFTALRTAIEDAVRPPAFTELLDRANRVRRRRITLAALGVGLLALAAVSLAGPVRQVAGRRAAPAPTPGPAFEVSDLVFTSTRTGYVVLGPCTAEASCSTTRGLAATDDGGRSWHRLSLPVDVADDTSLLLHADRTSVSLVVGDQRYVSDDGGRHWARASWLRDGPPVDSIPAGQSLTVFCPVGRARCEERVAALDPVRGVQRPLVHQPALPPSVPGNGPGLVVGEGGAWVASRAADGSLWLAHSPDRGRTWQELPGPAGHRWFRPAVLSDPLSGRTYLVDWSPTSGVIDGVWRLDRADPATWTAVTPARAGSAMQAQVLPGGELRYTDIAGHAWNTSHRGTRVARAPRARVDGVPVDVLVRQVVHGELVGTAAPGRRGDLVLFSTDAGRHWQVRAVRF